MEINLADLNVRAMIAFALVMIVVLLTYIAFYKDSVEGRRSRKSPK